MSSFATKIFGYSKCFVSCFVYKGLIQDLRDEGWEPLFKKVKSFCVKYDLELLNMNCRYVDFTKKK
jgi:hypothetical protein